MLAPCPWCSVLQRVSEAFMYFKDRYRDHGSFFRDYDYCMYLVVHIAILSRLNRDRTTWFTTANSASSRDADMYTYLLYTLVPGISYNILKLCFEFLRTTGTAVEAPSCWWCALAVRWLCHDETAKYRQPRPKHSVGNTALAAATTTEAAQHPYFPGFERSYSNSTRESRTTALESVRTNCI